MSAPEQFGQIVRFICVASNLKEEISLHSLNGLLSKCPGSLPTHLLQYLATHFSLDTTDISELWSKYGHVIWDMTPIQAPLSLNDIGLFQTFGSNISTKTIEKFTHKMFYPPMRNCPTCQHLLTHPRRYEVTYFTLRQGAVAAYTTSLACYFRDCPDNGRRFYHNYSVGLDHCSRKKIRMYYGGVPEAIQIEEHLFIDAKLCEFIAESMRQCWASASNIASVYNDTMSDPDHSRPIYLTEWPYSFHLTTDKVTHAFQIYSILLDYDERLKILLTLDAGTVLERVKTMVQDRNLRMKTIGDRLAREHTCTVCCVHVAGSGIDNIDRISAVVTDGVTVGHACCAVHNCECPLLSKRDKFCPMHDEYKGLCAIIDPYCGEPAEKDFRTCQNPSHRSLELHNTEKNKSFFQLRKRLQRAGIMHTASSANAEDLDDIGVEDDDTVAADAAGTADQVECNDKPTSGNKKIRARWGRRQAHNEQLIIRPCGVIVGRGTMFGSESVSNVVNLFKQIFTKAELPGVIFFDNNCSVQKHLHASGDNFFENCIMPVDVFHFKSKHSEKDIFCQQHCNPALWPELYNSLGQWVFNSSIAEQTNVWINGFHPMLREMTVNNYNFFLDEMIKRRNRAVIKKLKKDMKYPFSGAFL